MNYLLFAGNEYYPEGGANDLQDRFDTLKDAMAAHDPAKYDWAHILCLDSLNVVKHFHTEKWNDGPFDPLNYYLLSGYLI